MDSLGGDGGEVGSPVREGCLVLIGLLGGAVGLAVVLDDDVDGLLVGLLCVVGSVVGGMYKSSLRDGAPCPAI